MRVELSTRSLAPNVAAYIAALAATNMLNDDNPIWAAHSMHGAYLVYGNLSDAEKVTADFIEAGIHAVAALASILHFDTLLNSRARRIEAFCFKLA